VCILRVDMLTPPKWMVPLVRARLYLESAGLLSRNEAENNANGSAPDQTHTIVAHQDEAVKDTVEMVEVTPSPPQTVPALVIPPATVADTEVILPPTPTKQLLPLAETEGLTSGAVQPPGSTGQPVVHLHPPTAHDSAEESDGTSFTDEDDVDVGVEDPEDEEDRLISNGGAGIPIGPVSGGVCAMVNRP
jgi:RNA polymerase II subunit A small phosphatase-like protein